MSHTHTNTCPCCVTKFYTHWLEDRGHPHLLADPRALSRSLPLSHTHSHQLTLGHTPTHVHTDCCVFSRAQPMASPPALWARQLLCPVHSSSIQSRPAAEFRRRLAMALLCLGTSISWPGKDTVQFYWSISCVEKDTLLEKVLELRRCQEATSRPPVGAIPPDPGSACLHP